MVFDTPITEGRAPEAPPAASRRPLRVCTVAYTFYETDSRVIRYDEALTVRGDTVDAIALRGPEQPRVRVENGVTVIRVQPRTVNGRSPFAYLLRIILFFLRSMFVLSWRHLRCPYDVIHVHSVPEFLVFAAWIPKLTGARIILDIHDILPEFYASKFGLGRDSLLFKLLLLVERVSVAFSDHLITANDLWHEKLVDRAASPRKATVLLNFPDRSVFRQRGRGRSDGRFVMVYPGTLNWHQGLDIAIRAFAQIRDAAPHAEFHIYGAGPSLPDLRALAAELGLGDVVRFEGQLPLREIARVMENADLGVVPKRKDSFGDEAFSTKIPEFMAMGVPVVVSDTRIDSYYFDDSLVKFFRGGDVDHLADCMLQLIGSPAARETLRRGGLRFVQENCWDVKKTIYLDLVDSLVGGNR